MSEVENQNPADLSISEAFDKGMESIKDSGADQGSENGSEQEGEGNSDPKENGGEQGADNQEGAEPDNKGNEPQGKEPNVDPEKGVYEGEYTKERFNGLMSQWQKDRARLAELESAGKDKPADKPAPQDKSVDEIELPPELANADEESKAGFKLVVKALTPYLSKMQNQVLGQIMDHLNAPIREENETKSKIDNEVSALKVEGGKLFEQNAKEILQFAADNEYPLGTLKQAFRAWKREQELTGRISELTKGKKVLDEIDKEEKKNAEIPKHSKGVASTIPTFDPERDGNKSFDEIWKEAVKSF